MLIRLIVVKLGAAWFVFARGGDAWKSQIIYMHENGADWSLPVLFWRQVWVLVESL
uniref:Uncharacterized protein n=1 Tax=mine drainage metagenome TaxID=410659 RepID=E6QC50_9ZZZZ